MLRRGITDRGVAYAEHNPYGLVLEIAHAMGERFPMDVRWIANVSTVES